jgi:hypothetical protein
MWYNLDHEPISIEEAGALLRDGDARSIATTDIDADVSVSTVFLVLDHGWQGVLELYETMVFGGPCDSQCFRYSTRDAALAGHERVVALLRGGGDIG